MPFYVEQTGLGPSFKRIFGAPLEKFCDKELTFLRKKFFFDLIEFDDWLGKQDPEYDPENCTYKGQEEYSITMYVEEKYGKEANNLLDKLLEHADL